MTATRDLLALIDARRERRSLSRAPAYAERLAALVGEAYADLPILVGPDGLFPVAVLSLSPRSTEDVDRLSVSLGPPPSVPPVLDAGMLTVVAAPDRGIWNGTTFSLTALALDSRGRVDGLRAFLGAYFDMVASAGYLEVELLAALLRSGDRLSLDDLPARRRTLAGFRSSAECLANGGGIDAVLAVSTLLVYARGGTYWALYEGRSPAAAGFRFPYHVVPALIYQPVTAPTQTGVTVERSVVHNVEREYLEELFGLPEVEHAAAVPPDYFYAHPNLALLRALRASGAARLLGTAFVFNLLNHRPEICTVLLIDDESWYLRQRGDRAQGETLAALTLNDELAPSDAATDIASAERVGTLALSDERWRRIARPWVLTPPGAAALVLGARLAVERLRIEAPAWLAAFRVEPPRAGR